MAAATIPAPVSSTNAIDAFHWIPQPQTQKWLSELITDFLEHSPAAQAIAKKLRIEAGVRFSDLIDHIKLPADDPRLKTIESVGYRPTDAGCFIQPDGIFPDVIIGDRFEIALKVESVADFLASAGFNPLNYGDGPNSMWHGLRAHARTGEPTTARAGSLCHLNLSQFCIIGEPLSQIRQAVIGESDLTRFSIIERHGIAGLQSPAFNPARAVLQLKHFESFRTRQRSSATDADGFTHALRLIDAAIADLGIDLTCDLFFTAEREFWQRRNTAAQVQKQRQDRLGIGWANHDHHTYRSSRENFRLLVGVWERLGFKSRERFYAGREAGWGAQVMEQPVARIITFNDVDLSADELRNDFSHETLPKRDKLGTVGLWCGLHGDSFLQAGMHHLECQFDFDALRDQLEATGMAKVMKPFTSFPYLRQAFTEGERWVVNGERIARLLADGLITQSQATQFREHGAIGSHLENLERNDGFKGFNQEGVSEIIRATDPRAGVGK